MLIGETTVQFWKAETEEKGEFIKEPTESDNSKGIINDAVIANNKLTLANSTGLYSIDLTTLDQTRVLEGHFTHVKVSPCQLFQVAVHTKKIVLVDSTHLIPFYKIDGSFIDILISSDFVLAKSQLHKWGVEINLSES